jgi:hypothetical protein
MSKGGRTNQISPWSAFVHRCELACLRDLFVHISLYPFRASGSLFRIGKERRQPERHSKHPVDSSINRIHLSATLPCILSRGLFFDCIFHEGVLEVKNIPSWREKTSSTPPRPSDSIRTLPVFVSNHFEGGQRKKRVQKEGNTSFDHCIEELIF